MLKTTRLYLVALVAGLSLLPAAAFATAATSTGSQDVSCTVANAASLTLGSSTVTFPSADPGSVTSIPANENAIDVSASVRTGDASTATLTVVATDDLTDSSSDVIAINNITWTVTGSGYQAGTMSKTSAQTVGSWTGSGVYTGTMSYALANSWNYQTGSYTTTLNYTLTAP